MCNSSSAPVDAASSSLQQMSIHPLDHQNDQVAAKYLGIESQLNSALQDVIRNMKYKGFAVNTENSLSHDSHSEYVRKYCGRKKILFVGMNPGPNGAGKNGIPFGDENWVRDWLQIDITGYESERKEESGSRFWSLMATLCESANVFFHNSFVMNYCPLLFLDSKGDNIALEGLNKEYKTEIEKICDYELMQRIDLIKPEIVFAIGNYVYKRVNSVLCEPVRVEEKEVGKIYQRRVIVAKILHPSPKTKHSEDQWKKKVIKQMGEFPISVGGESLLDILQKFDPGLTANCSLAAPSQSFYDTQGMSSSHRACLVADKYLEIQRQPSSELQDVIRNMKYNGFAVNTENSLSHASHSEYVRKYCGRKKILFVGMNPVPNGAGKTGKERSGSRFWNLVMVLCGADRFFRNCFVMNYCPLSLFDSNGDNIALEGLDKEYKTEIEKICDDWLMQRIDLIQPEIVVAIGDYVYKRLNSVLCEPVRVEEKEVGKIYQRRVRVAKILKPSPRTGHSENKWRNKVKGQMRQFPIRVGGISLLDTLTFGRDFVQTSRFNPPWFLQ